MSGNEYDYIVVGSGAGGGPVAANLAKAGYRVCLMEAGGQGTPYNYQVPVFHPFSTEDPALRWEYFVRHYSDQAQQKKDDKFVEEKDGIFYPRAAHVGGCTSHHAMITIYPSNKDWDYIADITGDPSWQSDQMRKYFVRLEDCRYRPLLRILYKIFRWNPTKHGFGGWLPTRIAKIGLLFEDKQLLTTLAESLKRVIPIIGKRNKWLFRLSKSALGGFDTNSWKLVQGDTEGVRFTPLSIRGVKRSAVRELLVGIKKEFPENLDIKTEVLVGKILFDTSGQKPKATGVQYYEGPDLYEASPNYKPDAPLPESKEIRARREIIVAGGAFNTPQLLKLSGIGPKEELQKLGIEVLADRPGVGTNLQDRYEVGIVTEAKKDFSLLNHATFTASEKDPFFVEWEMGKEGVYSTNGAVISIIFKSDKTQPVPDLYVFGLVGPFKGYYPGYSEAIKKTQRAFTWAILKAHTVNRGGTVDLRSTDPRHVPEINFHYFEEGTDRDNYDLKAVSEGVQVVRKMIKATGGALVETYPGEDRVPDDPNEIQSFIRNNAWGHHCSCSCPIGPLSDERSVCDSRFQVIDTENLRIVDASIFPRIPGFFIVLPIFMVAEKASDVILEDAARPKI